MELDFSLLTDRLLDVETKTINPIRSDVLKVKREVDYNFNKKDFNLDGYNTIDSRNGITEPVEKEKTTTVIHKDESEVEENKSEQKLENS